jgi:hypothetical protein
MIVMCNPLPENTVQALHLKTDLSCSAKARSEKCTHQQRKTEDR